MEDHASLWVEILLQLTTQSDSVTREMACSCMKENEKILVKNRKQILQVSVKTLRRVWEP